MEFSRQEYWSGVPFPSPEDLPDPGIEPGSLTMQANTLPSEPPLKQPKYLAINILLNSSIHIIVQNTVTDSNKIGEFYSSCVYFKTELSREVGEGIGMGNTCKPMAVSFQCMTKSTTNKKIN